MTITVTYDLEKDEIVLATDFSHRAFPAKRQWNCRECGTVHRNALVETLRAVAIYEKSLARGERDVSQAILAYDLQEILARLGEETPVRHYHERARRVTNGCALVKRVPQATVPLSIDDLGDLE